MNGNQPGAPKNRNVAPPKQINRVAAPIQVTPQNNAGATPGNPNAQVVQTNQVQAAPMSSVAMAAQNQSIRGANAKKQKNIIKEHDPSTMIFVTILLMILAGLTAFVFYVIMPRINEEQNKVDYKDKTTEFLKPEKIAPSIEKVSLNNGTAITTSGVFQIKEGISLSTVDNGNGIDVSINDVKVATTKKVSATVGVVDDCIILIYSDGEIRSNRVVIYDKTGNEMKEISRFANAEGMLLFDDDSGFIYSSNILVMMASRVKGTTIILSDDFGSTEGVDLCNEEQLMEYNIDDNFIVMANYSLSYEGDNVFKDPYKISDTSLQEYRETNKLCR